MKKRIFKLLFTLLLVCIINCIFVLNKSRMNGLELNNSTFKINVETILQNNKKDSNYLAIENVKFDNDSAYTKEVAVLNYHFFYDPEYEECGEVICLDVRVFEEQIKYLVDNDYRILTLDEFIRWKHGEKKLPKKSVLITIDDGAKGTGHSNGNKLIPMLEKYKVNAVLFLITTWFDSKDYKSKYLELQSHGHDIHRIGECDLRRINCLNHDELKSDINKSLEMVDNNKSFAYPFFEYTDDSISVLKELGFDIAFVGGFRKASISDNDYLIPRYEIFNSTSMYEFISYLN